jgi:mannose-6-phosphate isomerase-like protein (cupin superfamily)
MMNNPSHERVLDLRSIFGVEARIITPALDTAGAYVEMDCSADPGSGTMVHYHPQQEESFQVMEGMLEVFQQQQWRRVQNGESLTVPMGVVHAWRNASTVPVRFLNVHRPAYGFQGHMETLDRLVKAGKVRGTNDPRSLLYMSMSAVKYCPDVTVKPPQWVVNMMAFIGRRLGYRLDGE